MRSEPRVIVAVRVASSKSTVMPNDSQTARSGSMVLPSIICGGGSNVRCCPSMIMLTVSAALVVCAGSVPKMNARASMTAVSFAMNLFSVFTIIVNPPFNFGGFLKAAVMDCDTIYYAVKIEIAQE
jgi:hypothetical protein